MRDVYGGERAQTRVVGNDYPECPHCHEAMETICIDPTDAWHEIEDYGDGDAVFTTYHTDCCVCGKPVRLAIIDYENAREITATAALTHTDQRYLMRARSPHA